VFHVAAVADYWRQGADRVYRVNVEGTQNVLAAAREAGVRRLVYTSSLAALGVPANGGPLTEADQFNLSPVSFPYGHSKHVAEGYVRAANDAALQTVIVNPSIILGPRDVNQISGSIITEAARGKLTFLLPGGVNFVAVEDVAAGHIAAAEKGRPGERYILGGDNLTYRQAIPIICRIVGRSSPRLPIPGWAIPAAAWGIDVARLLLGNRVPLDASQVRMSRVMLFADVTKARRELDLPQTPFAATVQRTYDWYRAQGYLTK
jgi:dihydroflavonol-4-reductase